MKKTVNQLDTFLRRKPRLGPGVYLARISDGSRTAGARFLLLR